MNRFPVIALFAFLMLPAAAQEPDRAAELEKQVSALQLKNDKLRELCVQLLIGRHYDTLKLKQGKEYLDVTITKVSPEIVEFTHGQGDERISIESGPDEWAPLMRSDTERGANPEIPKARRPGKDVAEAIVVIEGDMGAGTGFLVEVDGKVYLYTAAHVLSGNKRLVVKMQNGRKITSFGTFEASEGSDLVRLEVKEEIAKPLQIGSSVGQARHGHPIFAIGNSGGGGTVGFELGEIKGLGDDSMEIDAEVIQGNSGGPILDGTSHEVLGIVTHLVAGRSDDWARETRFSDIRRFGCRLDREWRWRELSIGEFLKEGQALKEVNDLNQLVILALQPGQWQSGELGAYEGHRIVKEIRAIEEWIREKGSSGTGVSESDQNKKIYSLFDGIRSSAKRQIKGFKPKNYVWFHRESAAESVKLRKKLIKACDEAIDKLR